MLRKYRIGNDIPVTWKISTNGERTSLEGRSLEVKCEDALGGTLAIEWRIVGADVCATIPGREQRTPGLLTLTLVENPGMADMHTVDVMLLELVAHTWQTGLTPAGEVVLATANIETSLSVAQILELKGIASAESARVAAEAERVAAESARASKQVMYDDAERIRVRQENDREQYERARDDAEEARYIAELLRVQAEKDRDAAEQLRTGRAAEDHEQAAADHSAAESDHARAGSDHATATSDHEQAATDHSAAEGDHTRAGSDHATATSDHRQAATDHDTAASDHAQAVTAAEAEAARVAAEAARVEEYEGLTDAIRSAAENAEEAAQAAAAAQSAADALSRTTAQVATNTSDIEDLKSRVTDLEFEQGDYYVEAYEPGTTDVVPVHAYGNKNLLKQFDFILLDTSDNTGEVTHKAGVLQRNNLLRFKDGAWAPVVGITAEQAADAQLELFGLSGGEYVQYCEAGAYDAEAYVEEVLRPWYAGTLEDYDGLQLYKSDGAGGYTEAHALCPWETTETKYSIGLGAQHRLYVLDNVVGESGKVWKGLFLDKTEWDGIDLTQYALEPTAISPCPVCTILENGVRKTRSFFYLHSGDTNCTGATGINNTFSMFAPGNRTYPHTSDMAQVNNMNWARANNADAESPVPYAEGGYFALNAFIIAQELLYSRRNPFRASQFGSGISSNDTCNSETTWRTNGGIRFRKSGAAASSYATFSANAPVYYMDGATPKRTDWSNTLNKYAPKEECMESQIVASFAAEFGVPATTDATTPHYFEVYGGKYYYMSVPNALGLEDGYMNVRLYRELEQTGTGWVDAEGNAVEYDIAVVLRMSLMGGANLSGDIFAYWGGGCEVVGTCGENTANNTAGHVMNGYMEPNQAKWMRETAISKADHGRFDFEAEDAYPHMGSWFNMANGYAIQRDAYLPRRTQAGGNMSQGECYYSYEGKYWSSTVGTRVRVGLRFRGYALYAFCSPRYWYAFFAASYTYRYIGGSAQARFE